MPGPELRLKLLAEFFGTAFLLIGVVGSGIMGQALAGGNTAIALLANAIATGCALYVLITILAPLSGAHFNPAVTLAFWLRGAIDSRSALLYMPCQIVGAIAGVWATHLMFGLDILQSASTARDGFGLWWSEFLAAFGLVMAILGGVRHRPDAVATLVAVYITGAYWFTASTSFANPAVTVARGFTDSFTGIAPPDIPAFVVAQLVGGGLAALAAFPIFGGAGR